MTGAIATLHSSTGFITPGMVLPVTEYGAVCASTVLLFSSVDRYLKDRLKVPFPITSTPWNILSAPGTLQSR